MIDYMNYIPEEFKDRTIPTFLKTFLSLNGIIDDDKYKFIKHFVIRYFTDYEFKETVQGWYIYIIDDKYDRWTSHTWVDYLGDYEKDNLKLIKIEN